jgi:hypothetical protein
MKPFLPILAAFITAVGVTGYATAERSGQAVFLDRLVSEWEHAIEPVSAPVSADLLFAETELAPDFNPAHATCVPASEVLAIFAREIEIVGGEILTPAGRLQQDLADHWRRTAGVATVDVSRVVAHFVPGRDGDAMVDVVEIDTKDCAFSRTLLTGIEWVGLIQAARGPEV